MKYIKFHSDRGFHEIILSQKERQEFSGALLFANMRGQYSSEPYEGIFFIHDRHASQVNKLLGFDLIPVQGPGFGLTAAGAVEGKEAEINQDAKLKTETNRNRRYEMQQQDKGKFCLVAMVNYGDLKPGDLLTRNGGEVIRFDSREEAVRYAALIEASAYEAMEAVLLAQTHKSTQSQNTEESEMSNVKFAIIVRKNYEELRPGDLLCNENGKVLKFDSPAEAMAYATCMAGKAVIDDGVLDWLRLL